MDQPAVSTMFGDNNTFIAQVLALGNTVHGDLIMNDNPYDVSALNAYNPYLGLKAFTYADRALYAGRDTEIQRAVAYLTAPGEQRSVLFVTGASGSGKSSFVQAGVIPALGQWYGHKTVHGHVLRPSRYPLALLRDGLERLDLSAPAALTPHTWHSTLQTTPANQVNILIIDQFEELFTQTADPEHRAVVIELLTTMPPFAQTRTHILVTVRADYLSAMLDDSTALYELATQGIALGAMRETDLRAAIQQPLRWFQSTYPQIRHKAFAPALLVQLVADTQQFNQTLENRDAYLPLLQVTLEDLWNRGMLTRGAYTSLITGLQTRAHDVYQFTADPHGNRLARSPEQQQALLALLLDLVDVSLMMMPAAMCASAGPWTSLPQPRSCSSWSAS